MKLRFLLALAAISCAPAVLAQVIHLSPVGRDTNDGLAADRPLATLQRALDVAVQVTSHNAEVLVQVEPGRYNRQAVVTSARTDGTRIHIAGRLNSAGAGPEFVGDPYRKLTWLTLKAATGRPTGLVISGLHIREYKTAISLEGDREREAAYNAGNVIRNNVFEEIGSLAGAGKYNSTAAIRLSNSKDNLIEDNRFRSIRNAEGCGSLHAIYAAHFSAGNIIRRNDFTDLCGSAIKLRDRSNGNLIERNTFSRLEKVPAVEEWFCDMSARKDCTKKQGECPSTGNHVVDNQLQSAEVKLIDIVGGHTPRGWCTTSDFASERVRLGARPQGGSDPRPSRAEGSHRPERGPSPLEEGLRLLQQLPALVR
jgi:hypothetical protein